MRLKSSDNASASVRIISVLANPGTPTSKQWPRAKIEIKSSSMTLLLAHDHFAEFVSDLLKRFVQLLHGLNVVFLKHGGVSNR